METIIGFLFLIACGIGMHKLACFLGNKFKFAENSVLFYRAVKRILKEQ